MKKVLVAIIVLAFSIALGGGYQNAKWGMTPDEVKKAMPDKKWKNAIICNCIGRAIWYKDEMFGKDVVFVFYFDKENKLEKVALGGSFLISTAPFSEIFLQLKKALTEKYGQPNGCLYQVGSTIIKECVGENGIFKTNNTTTYLFGDLSPRVVYTETWIKEDTIITLAVRRRPPEMLDLDSPLTYEPIRQSTPQATPPETQDKI